MKRIARRRLKNIAALVVGLGLLALVIGWLESSLARTAYLTGYLLLGAVVFLAAYQLRKRLPALPLGTSRMWLQFHIYIGVGSVALFAWHTGWPGSILKNGSFFPNGWLEGSLALAYLCTFGSGLWGLYLTRTIPSQLARTSEEVIYERIPELRNDIITKSRAAVLTAVEDRGATTLADFYTNRIEGYLCEPRGLLYAFRPTSTLRRHLLSELTELGRFLTRAEARASEQLFALLRKKDDLDFHQARQGLLKGWLFVHITLTYGLLMLAFVHGALALWMRGGPS